MPDYARAIKVGLKNSKNDAFHIYSSCLAWILFFHVDNRRRDRINNVTFELVFKHLFEVKFRAFIFSRQNYRMMFPARQQVHSWQCHVNALGFAVAFVTPP